MSGGRGVAGTRAQPGSLEVAGVRNRGPGHMEFKK